MRGRGLIRAAGTGLLCLFAVLAVSSPAGAATSAPDTGATAASHNAAGLRGVTQVTTAPGIAATLLKAKIVPLPVPSTSFGLVLSGGLAVRYGFPIVGGDPDLSGPSGDILHSGGIDFVSTRGKHLEIGRFDISLDDGVIYATQVNFAPGRIPVLDLDLSGLRVSTSRGATVLSGITLRLDPAAAGALNATFGIALPTDGSLVFGSARLTLRS